MSSKHKQTHEFTLEAQLLGFVFKGNGTVKGLRVATDRGVWPLKLDKSVRSELPPMEPGDRLQVGGEKVLNLKKGTAKFKVLDLANLSRPAASQPSRTPAKDISPAKSSGSSKILVCQKSSCCKRGGRAVFEALEKEIERHDLGDRVSLKKTGCLKGCKRGPNMVVASDKKRYEKMTPERVGEVLERHFGGVEEAAAAGNGANGRQSA